VRFAAGIPRGAINNVVSLNDLLTAVGPTGTLTVEGRTARDLHTEYVLGSLCDPAKLRPDLKISLITVGTTQGLGYLAPVCPHGFSYDPPFGGLPDFGWDDLALKGEVTDVDPEERVFEVGGARFHDIPGARLIRYRYQEAGSTITPVSLEDIHRGDKVQVHLNGRAFQNNVRPISSAWFGDVYIDDGKFYADSTFDSSSNGDLVIYSGIRIAVDPAAELRGCDAELHTDAQAYLQLLAANGHPVLNVFGRIDTGKLVAERVASFGCQAP
jgi:hypothetical protein